MELICEATSYPASEAREYNPDYYDLKWNADYTAFVPRKLRWTDDASYAAYQAGWPEPDYNAEDFACEGTEDEYEECEGWDACKDCEGCDECLGCDDCLTFPCSCDVEEEVG